MAIDWVAEGSRPKVTRRCPVSRQATVTVNDTMILPVLPNGSHSHLLREPYPRQEEYPKLFRSLDTRSD